MFQQVIRAHELLSDPHVTSERIVGIIREIGTYRVEVKEEKEIATTQFLKVWVPGRQGKSSGGDAPTLGVVGNLGGVGARPEIVGLVSDADGAITALSVLLKLITMHQCGDSIAGDVIVSTHICPQAPTIPHDPVPFMGNPTREALTKNQNYVDASMDAIVHVETSRGNRVINWRGFAITPTIKENYILRVSNDLMDIMQNVTGDVPRIVPLTTQDVTPVDNGLYHMNGLAQETMVSDAPIVGVALTGVVPVAGCATGASQTLDMEAAARFIVEVANAYTAGKCSFYDADEFLKITTLYGSMKHLRKSS